MAQARPTRLDRPVDMRRDHALGNPEAELTREPKCFVHLTLGCCR
jgi:hypothetical protein